MDNMGNKKLALIYILKILEEYSDMEHPLTQSDIMEKLEDEYGIVLERKAISRNLSLLKEAGYEIESHAKGNYIAYRDFDNSELRLMIDAVLSSRYITEKHAKELSNKIAGLSNKFFRARVKHIHTLGGFEKGNNKAFFYALDCIDEAIENGRQISFDYARYVLDENFKPTRTERLTVSPIQLVIKNQFYYLIASEEVDSKFSRHADKGPTCPKINSYRLDLISNPIIEEELAVDTERLKKYGLDKDVKAFLSEHPYMKDKSSPVGNVSFLCFAHDMSLVFENLGANIKIKKLKRKDEERFKEIDTSRGKYYVAMNLVKVSIKMSIREFVEFANRYPSKIFILTPVSARARQESLYKSHLELAGQIREYDEI